MRFPRILLAIYGGESWAASQFPGGLAEIVLTNLGRLAGRPGRTFIGQQLLLAVNQPGVCVICGRRFVSKRGHMIITWHWPKVAHLYGYYTQISYAYIYDVMRRAA